MNFSYKRYWEPSYGQLFMTSAITGTLANVLTYPIEFVKTRIQVRAEGVGIRNKNFQAGYNPHEVFRQIHSTGRGMGGFYEGISSYIAARAGYHVLRNLIFKAIYDQKKPYKVTNDLSHREKAVIGSIAGGLAALITQPFELINTRIIADGGIYKPNRRNYTSIGEAYNKIAAEGAGSQGLFRGGLANVLRIAALNSSLTGPYDYLNEKCWITFGDMYWVNNTLALFFASAVGTGVVAPFDNIKTRLMIQFPDAAKNRIGYKGYMDVVAKIFQNEGIFSFWVGYTALYYKVLVFSATTLFIQNNMFIRGWKKDAGLEEWQI